MTKPLPPRNKIRKKKLKPTPLLPKDINWSCRRILRILAVPSGTVMIPVGLTFTRMITPTAFSTSISVIMPTTTMMVSWSYSPKQPILTSYGLTKSPEKALAI